jgi:hypothetical protein
MNISGTCEFLRAQEGSLSSVVERASKSVMLHVPRCAAALPQPLPRPTAAACGRPHLPSAHADLCPPPPITIAGVAAKVPSAPVTWAPGYGEHPAHTVRSLPHAWSTALYLAPATSASPCFHWWTYLQLYLLGSNKVGNTDLSCRRKSVFALLFPILQIQFPILQIQTQIQTFEGCK